MDSDDEFEIGVTAGTKVLNGLNLRELIETGTTNFTMDGDVDLHDNFDPAVEEKKRLKEEVDALADLEESFMKGYDSSVRFSGRDENGEVLCDFDNSYDDLEKRMESVVDDGKIKKLIVRPGFGDQIVPGQVVYIHYTVYAEGKDVIVDNSRAHVRRGKKGEPFRFKVGAGDVIPVIDIAVATMQPRESAKFLAQPEYAYGELGCLPRVPPMTRVLVAIEICGVAEGTIRANLQEMDSKERMLLPFDELCKGVEELKLYGNDSFKEEEYGKAKRQYKQALKILRDVTTPDLEQNAVKAEMMYKLLINTAQCGIMKKEFKSAKAYCEEAIYLPDLPRQKKIKAFYRLARCFHELGDVKGAKENIITAKTLNPTDEDINELYDKIVKKLVKDRKEEKSYSEKMFKD